jgi:hypothetical protein
MAGHPFGFDSIIGGSGKWKDVLVLVIESLESTLRRLVGRKSRYVHKTTPQTTKQRFKSPGDLWKHWVDIKLPAAKQVLTVTARAGQWQAHDGRNSYLTFGLKDELRFSRVPFDAQALDAPIAFRSLLSCHGRRRCPLAL